MESWDDGKSKSSEVTIISAMTNKWEGEDEDDDVKESWEDEEKESEASVEVVKPKPQKLPLTERIAERQRRKREQMEKKLREQEAEYSAKEKNRMRREWDLELATGTTFENHPKHSSLGLDHLPSTKKEFEDFTEALSSKLLTLSKTTEYPVFTENLSRNLCATMSSLDIKKIKNNLDSLYLERQKMEKCEKAKRNKVKGKAKLKLDEGNALSACANDYDELDDFL